MRLSTAEHRMCLVVCVSAALCAYPALQLDIKQKTRESMIMLDSQSWRLLAVILCINLLVESNV